MCVCARVLMCSRLTEVSGYLQPGPAWSVLCGNPPLPPVPSAHTPRRSTNVRGDSPVSVRALDAEASVLCGNPPLPPVPSAHTPRRTTNVTQMRDGHSELQPDSPYRQRRWRARRAHGLARRQRVVVDRRQRHIVASRGGGGSVCPQRLLMNTQGGEKGRNSGACATGDKAAAAGVREKNIPTEKS